MRKSVNVQTGRGGFGGTIEVPDNCPICHRGIDPVLHGNGWFHGEPTNPTKLQVLLRCPRDECQRIFIAGYDRVLQQGVSFQDPSGWADKYCEPAEYLGRTFEEAIETASPAFVRIYQQAEKAQASGLDEICGPGYRKSLEFLIKDYLISRKGMDRSVIEGLFLGKCIKDHVDDPRVRSSAERAVWLGNDATHYVRTWTHKDVGDLKKLIDLTVHWVAADILTKELEASMQ